MDLEDIRRLVTIWIEQGKQVDHMKDAAGIINAQMLLYIYDKLCSIEDGIASLEKMSWDDHHGR